MQKCRNLAGFYLLYFIIGKHSIKVGNSIFHQINN